MTGATTSDSDVLVVDGNRPFIASCNVAITEVEASFVKASASIIFVAQCFSFALFAVTSSFSLCPRTAKYLVRQDAPHIAIVIAA